MAKISASAATTLVKEIRVALEARIEDRGRPGAAPGSKGAIKGLGVRSAAVKAVAKELLTKFRATIDYSTAIALVDATMARKVREEILVAIEILDRFRREFEPSIFAQLEKWSSLADDLEVADALGSRVAAPALALDPSKMTVVRKWARLKSAGRRQLALLAASALVTEGRREAAPVLELCEVLLHEEHPTLVAGVASLLRETTKIDAKAVQDFLFRRSIDGNPDILRAGSENLDAARRAALIAKLEAQAMAVAAR